ncbi:MAG: hypothetical protein ACRKFN_11575 [Desulfitobacterium sp.]
MDKPNFDNEWSQKILNSTLKRISAGEPVETAIQNSITVAMKEIQDQREKVILAAAGGEVKDYLNRLSQETGLGPYFLAGLCKERRFY